MALDDSHANNTPPRSPDDLHIMEDDIIEIIELGNGPVEFFEDDEEDLEDVSVALPERDDAFATLTHHEAPVLACACHPTLPYVVATGGMDNKLVVWDCSGVECKILMDYSPDHNMESIDCVKFSPDGSYLAACDLNGNAHMFSCEGNCSYLGTVDQDMDFAGFIWHPSNKAFIIITCYTVTIHKLPDFQSKIVIGKTDGNFTCAKLFPDGNRIAVGDTKGNVRVIDLKTTNVLSSCLIKAMGGGQGMDEDCVIYCMDIHSDNKSVICGSNKGLIANVNAETGKASYYPVTYEELLDCEVVECGRQPAVTRFLVSGHRSGHIRFWDFNRSVLRFENKTDVPVTSMKWHPFTPHVFTGHSDGKILMSFVNDGSVVREFLGHEPMVLSIDISSDGNFLVSTSDDRLSKVFAIIPIQPEPPVPLQQLEQMEPDAS